MSGYVRGAGMSWVNPDWFLWAGLALSTWLHVMYWTSLSEAEEAGVLTWFLSGAFACFLGYLAFSSLQA